MRSRITEHSQAGLTLVELMISLVIASVAIAASMALGFSLNRTFKESRKMSDVERAGRASMDVITNVVRAASPAVRTGDLEDHIGCDDALHAIRVVNNNNIADELIVIHGTGAGTAIDPTAGTITELSANYGGAASIDVYDATGFFVGDYIVVSSIDHGFIAEITNIAGLKPATITLATSLVGGTCAYARGVGNNTAVAAGTYPAGSIVVRAGIAHFYVCPDATAGAKCTGTESPTLMMDVDGTGVGQPGQPIAMGIEDMQIAIGVDLGGIASQLDEVRVVANDDDWVHNFTGEVLTGTPPSANPQFIRALRVSLVARSVSEPSGQISSTQRPALEDRPAEVAANFDAFRRRTMTTRIEIRNIGGP